MIRILSYIIFGLWGALHAGFVRALPPATTDDNAIIKAIEDRANATTSWQSDFTQTINGQSMDTGRLYVQKPGKLRFVYHTSPNAIVADGKYLIYYDENIDQPTYMEIENTPAILLLKSGLCFTDFGTIIHVNHTSYDIEVYMELNDGSTVTFFFDKKSLLLQGWVLNDFQGNQIKVSLSHIKTNVALDPDLFIYKRKRLAK